MKFFIIAALAVVTLAAESPYFPKPPYKPAYPKPAYPAPAYPAPAYPAPAYPAPAYPPSYGKSYDYAPMPYDFDWAVLDEPSYNDFGHKETSDGKVVTGTYYVALPDGRRQIVTYKADEYGYVADVKYEGEAKYPEYKPAYPAYPKPAYPAPAYPKASYPEPAYPKPTYAPKPTYPSYSPPAYPSYPKPSHPSYPRPAYPSYPKPSYPAPTTTEAATEAPAPVVVGKVEEVVAAEPVAEVAVVAEAVAEVAVAAAEPIAEPETVTDVAV